MAQRSSINAESVLYLALGAAAVYVLVKYVLPSVKSLGTAATAATNATAGGIASVINWATGVSAPSPAALTGQRGVVMPDGSIVPLSSFQGIVASADSTQLYGIYNGTDYTISGPVDANGNYTAS